MKTAMLVCRSSEQTLYAVLDKNIKEKVLKIHFFAGTMNLVTSGFSIGRL